MTMDYRDPAVIAQETTDKRLSSYAETNPADVIADLIARGFLEPDGQWFTNPDGVVQCGGPNFGWYSEPR